MQHILTSNGFFYLLQNQVKWQPDPNILFAQKNGYIRELEAALRDTKKDLGDAQRKIEELQRAREEAEALKSRVESELEAEEQILTKNKPRRKFRMKFPLCLGGGAEEDDEDEEDDGASSQFSAMTYNIREEVSYKSFNRKI